MKSVKKTIEALCQPAYLYFIISVISMMIMMIQNLVEGQNILCLGEYKCETQSAPLVFVGQAVYILIWTKVLDMLCKKGLGSVSWFIVLFPYILMFIILGLFMLNVGVKPRQSVSGMIVNGELAGSAV